MIKKSFLIINLVLLLASPVFLIKQSKTAFAANAADWQAGRIIDDVLFSDPNTMTTAQIQDFLNKKVGTGTYGVTPGQCDTNGVAPSEYGGGTRAQYGAAHGNPAPFTCLKDFYEVPKTDPGAGIPANNYGGQAIPVGAKSAAQIIWDAAQRYSISPKVILTTIQKESAGPLTTDDWPFLKQYTYAMGAHCPDTSSCDPNYAGFSIQIYESARLFRYYLDNMGQSWWPYKRPGDNTILYNPNTGCGSSVVSISTQATAALYTYTPYQPNQAALNNLYGTGDSCSAYGNRNFWRIYTDWFGSTYAPSYSAQPVWQSVFTDSSKSTSLGWNATLVVGRSAYAVVQMRNTGNVTWANTGENQTRLVTYDPWGRQSKFCTANWIPTSPSCTRPTTLKESSVAPGQVGTFEFPISAPSQAGTYNEEFSLVIDGKSVFSSGVVNFQFTVQPETNAAQPVWQSVFTDSSKSTSLGWNATLVAGHSAYAVVQLRNTGNIAWTKGGNNDATLGTVFTQDRNSEFCVNSWLFPCKRIVTFNESSVAPGQVGTFEFPITAPSQAGTYNESFGLVSNGRGYFPNGYVTFQFTVEAERNSAQPVWQSVFTDSSKSTSLGWNATLSRGQSAYAVVQFKNTGNVTWTKNGNNDPMLGTVLPQDRNSAFCVNSWLFPCKRVSLLTESSVAPGQVGTFEFPITAPSQAGTYNESFGLVINGKGYFPNGYMNFKFTVQ